MSKKDQRFPFLFLIKENFINFKNSNVWLINCYEQGDNMHNNIDPRHIYFTTYTKHYSKHILISTYAYHTSYSKYYLLASSSASNARSRQINQAKEQLQYWLQETYKSGAPVLVIQTVNRSMLYWMGNTTPKLQLEQLYPKMTDNTGCKMN